MADPVNGAATPAPTETPSAAGGSADGRADAPTFNHREFVELRQDVRKLGKMLEQFQGGGRPPAEERRQQQPEGNSNSDVMRELSFRDALDGLAEGGTMLTRDQKARLRKLYAADQPTNAEEWLGKEVQALGFGKEPAKPRATVSTPPAGRIDHPVTTDNIWNANPDVVKAMPADERRAWFERSTGLGINASNVLKRHQQRMKK
jgi:hypothetical protein